MTPTDWWIWIHWHRARHVRLGQDRIDRAAGGDRNVLRPMQRQPVPERAEVCTVDGNFVLRRFGQYQQIEAFAVPDRAATVAFLRPDHLVLDRVAHDRVLVRSNANV